MEQPGLRGYLFVCFRLRSASGSFLCRSKKSARIKSTRSCLSTWRGASSSITSMLCRWEDFTFTVQCSRGSALGFGPLFFPTAPETGSGLGATAGVAVLLVRERVLGAAEAAGGAGAESGAAAGAGVTSAVGSGTWESRSNILRRGGVELGASRLGFSVDDVAIRIREGGLTAQP